MVFSALYIVGGCGDDRNVIIAGIVEQDNQDGQNMKMPKG